MQPKDIPLGLFGLVFLWWAVVTGLTSSRSSRPSPQLVAERWIAGT
jgi:hypothetical protein